MLESVLTHIFAGEQGKVDESMREMAAIEALKSEKADKEVRILSYLAQAVCLTLVKARAPTINRHVRSVRPPKAPCL